MPGVWRPLLFRPGQHHFSTFTLSPNGEANRPAGRLADHHPGRSTPARAFLIYFSRKSCIPFCRSVILG